MSPSSPLAWTYLLIAIGLSFTGDSSVDHTSERIGRASRLLSVVKPGDASKSLAVLLVLSAVILATLTVRTTPELLVEAGRHFGKACAASIGWAGTMSAGAAFFGASAHAALKAL